MGLEQRTIKMRVIGKRERAKGFVFKKQEYLIALQIAEGAPVVETAIGLTTQREVKYHQYCALNVGDKIDIKMYAPNINCRTWYFSREEAELFGQ